MSWVLTGTISWQIQTSFMVIWKDWLAWQCISDVKCQLANVLALSAPLAVALSPVGPCTSVCTQESHGLCRALWVLQGFQANSMLLGFHLASVKVEGISRGRNVIPSCAPEANYLAGLQCSPRPHRSGSETLRNLTRCWQRGQSRGMNPLKGSQSSASSIQSITCT